MVAAVPPRPSLFVPRPNGSRSPANAAAARRWMAKPAPRESLHSVDLEEVEDERISSVGHPRSDTHARATLLDSSEQPDALDVVLDALRDVKCERAVEAASVCLATLAHAVGCRAAIAHLWDSREQDFVVVYALAENAGVLLNARHGADDPLFAEAFAKRSPRVLSLGGERAPRPRHAVVPGSWSVLVAPVMEQDRKLGVLELVDPLDGSCFDDRAVAAAHYVSERLVDLLHGACTNIGKVIVADLETEADADAG